MQLGEIIRKYRQSKGWTIAEFAEKAGISRPYASQIETHANVIPSVEKIRSIADALDIPVSTLLSVAKGSSYSAEYVKEALDYNELYQKINEISKFVKTAYEKEPGLVEKYNFMATVDEEIQEMKAKLDELCRVRQPQKYEPAVEILISDLIEIGEQGQKYVKRQIAVYREIVQCAKEGKK